jgi:CMP-N-acetylneuraminic acid synthetase
MYKNKKFLAIIPARGGSKRLPRKNILDLAGKPLIAWTIEAALNSKYIDRVVVSTDDDEIALISKQYGADVPFIRSAKLAKDTSGSVDVIKDTVKKLEEMNDYYQYVILLQPTSPMRTKNHIDEAIDLLLTKNADSVISVAPVNHPVEWTNTLQDDCSMSNFFSAKHEGMRSQDFPVRYIVNGSIYINKIETLIATNSLINCGNGFAYVMKENDSIDIDNKIDLIVANALLMEEMISE